MQEGLQTYIIAISMPDCVQNILEILELHGFEAYIVGGCVRDSLLGLKPKDWDITSNAKPTQIQQIFSNTANKVNFDIFPIGLKYGTLGIKDKATKQIVEITTYRTDGIYKDGRRPESIQFAKTIKDDLSRRDFTINALACRIIKKDDKKMQALQMPTIPINHALESNLKTHNIDSIKTCDMQLVDYYNGLTHLKMRIIACVGKAEQRFLEDSLRIMRAIRFSAVLPFEFKIHNETKKALQALTEKLDCIARERIQDEFAKLLCGKYAHNALTIYQNTILFIMPILKHLTKKQLEHNYKAISLAPKNVILRLVLLCCPIPYTKSTNEKNIDNYLMRYKATCQYLHFDNKTIQTSLTLLQLICNGELLKTDNSKIALKYLLSKYDIQIVWQLVFLYAILQKTNNFISDSNKDSMESSITKIHNLTNDLTAIILNNECYKLSQLAINGNILQDLAKSMGISLQGRQIGTLLKKLLKDVIEEKIPNDTHILITESKEYIRNICE